MFSRTRSFLRLAWIRVVRLPAQAARLLGLAIIAIAVCASAPAARADTIAALSPASVGETVFVNVAFGQSVTTPGGSAWTDIIFNFYASPSTPFANGSLYLLDHAYLGTPANLSSETSLGVGTASGGTWTFDSSVVLQPGTKYWFYMRNIGTDLRYGNGNPYGGGEAYFSQFGTGNYQLLGGDTAFLLQGTEAVPLPIPGAGLLSYLLVGFGGLAAFRKKLRARATSLFAALRLRWPAIALLKPGALKRARA